MQPTHSKPKSAKRGKFKITLERGTCEVRKNAPSRKPKLVYYSCLTETPIKEDQVYGEIGFVFGVNSKTGNLHVSMPWAIGDSEHWIDLSRIEVKRRRAFMQNFCRECFKLARRMQANIKKRK